MKKILFFCFSFILFSLSVQAKTNYIYLGNKIDNVKLHIKTATIEKDKYMYEIINKSTNELVYCIEPGISLINGNFEVEDFLANVDIDLTTEQWDYIKLIAYYGYGYDDRLDINWYAATQYMIWDYLLINKGDIYFIDNNGNQINMFEDEILTINNDIKNHYIIPSFINDNYKGYYNEAVTVVDNNNVLDNFEIKYSDNTVIKKDKNSVTMYFKNFGPQQVLFVKNTLINNQVHLYTNGDSQIVFSRGFIPNVVGSLIVDIAYPSLKINKVSDEINNLSLKGTKYGIFLLDGTLFKTVELDENGLGYWDNIMDLNDYYLQELEPAYGYELNQEKIFFSIRDYDVNINTKNSLIKKKVILTKYLETKTDLDLPEIGAVFELYQDNKLLGSYLTDENGQINLTLPYGNYVLKQRQGTDGYVLADDIYFTIDDKTENIIYINLENKRKTGNVLFKKIDMNTKELINDNCCFKIFDNNNQVYINKDGKDIFCTNNGLLNLDNLPYGSYEIKEIIAPTGYYLLNNSLAFDLNTDYLEIEITNQLKTGQLIIEKYDYDSLDKLEGVSFGLYDADKNFLLEKVTDSNGKILFDNLPLGVYYIKELKAKDNYDLIDDFVKVEIKENISSTIKVNNRLQIDIPKTGSHILLYIILSASILLALGVYICNRED